MDVKRMWIKRALDTTNAFITSQTYAGYVNPAEYDYQLRDYVAANTVVAALGEQFDFTKPGSTWTVTIDAAPTAAASVAETADVGISAITNSQITFTPAEYAKAYQTTRKEMARGFFDIMANMTRKIGYSLGLIRDTTAYLTCYSGAGNSVVVNGVSALTDLTTTDTLNYAAIIAARKEIRKDYFRTDGGFLVISPTQEADLLALGTINKVNEFGDNEALRNAYIGRLFGFDIMVSDAVVATSNVQYALAIGRHPSGERAFGFARKRLAMIESEYHALGRYWDFVGHEEWDVKVLHANALCKIATYEA